MKRKLYPLYASLIAIAFFASACGASAGPEGQAKVFEYYRTAQALSVNNYNDHTQDCVIPENSDVRIGEDIYVKDVGNVREIDPVVIDKPDMCDGALPDFLIEEKINEGVLVPVQHESSVDTQAPVNGYFETKDDVSVRDYNEQTDCTIRKGTRVKMGEDIYVQVVGNVREITPVDSVWTVDYCEGALSTVVIEKLIAEGQLVPSSGPERK